MIVNYLGDILMECLFIGVKKLNCSLHQRCEGIYQIMLNLGANRKESNNFSKYVWRRYFYNKLNDITHDPTNSAVDKIIKQTAKILSSISKPFIRDSYGLEDKIAKIESQLIQFEKSSFLEDPYSYFSHCGDAYGLVFRKASVLSQSKSLSSNAMYILGQRLGLLIAMRDSIQDLKLDKHKGSFNPFRDWNKSDVIDYYNKRRKVAVEDINNLIQFKLSIKGKTKAANTSDVFKGISLFANASSSPYVVCKKRVQTLLNNYAQGKFPTISYLAETDGPVEDTCQVNCCASTCDELCHIPNNPCKSCCECCDCCADCGSGCSTCI